MKQLHPIKAILYSILVVGFICISPVRATTPDGETPAVESVCDPLTADDVTPGLYGLCVAYCEAHDADLYDPETACSTAESRILANYNRKKSESDPAMPCLEEPCHCWSFSDVEVFYTASKVSCTRGIGSGDECFSISLTTIDDNDETVSASILDNSISGLGYCQFNDNPRVEFESLDQQYACSSMLEDIISARQQPCKKKIIKCKK